MFDLVDMVYGKEEVFQVPVGRKSVCFIGCDG